MVGSAGFATAQSASDDEQTVIRHLRGDRYCEVLLVTPTEGEIVADVYSSYGPNDCPEDLWAGLGDRLELPEGWTYRSHMLRTPLRVVTTTTKAAVLQDDLGNSYSRHTG